MKHKSLNDVINDTESTKEIADKMGIDDKVYTTPKGTHYCKGKQGDYEYMWIPPEKEYDPES